MNRFFKAMPAKHAGMPRSAVATGLADYVMDAGQRPAQLIKQTTHAITEPKAMIASDEDQFQTALNSTGMLCCPPQLSWQFQHQ
ncbi:MAG: hypothetical protein KKC20_05240 [Proteobacteria bacterium]|nr:hypothetical protein [Pseudomonadota bacterium]